MFTDNQENQEKKVKNSAYKITITTTLTWSHEGAPNRTEQKRTEKKEKT